MPDRHFFLKLTVGRLTFPESPVCGVFLEKNRGGQKRVVMGRALVCNEDNEGDEVRFGRAVSRGFERL